jgi:hypothetical protein
MFNVNEAKKLHQILSTDFKFLFVYHPILSPGAAPAKPGRQSSERA